MRENIDEYLALFIIGCVLVILAFKNPFTGSVKDIIQLGLGGLIGYLGKGAMTARNVPETPSDES